MEDKAHEFLKEWIISFIKNRDLIHKRVESIKEEDQGFDICIKFKDKEQFFVVEPVIEDIKKTLSRFDTQRHFGLVVLNTSNNFNTLLSNWKDFVNIKNLCIYFINPFSNLDKKWIIYPHTHNNICEDGALEKGLRAMYAMVEPLPETKIKDKFK